MWKVLVTEPFDRAGIDLLRGKTEVSSPSLVYATVDERIGLDTEELKAIIGDYDALLVRSQTRVGADVIEKAQKLQVIGRAGVGVDNIDVEAATRKGIVVVNAPTANIIAAAEHTVALMLALARNIPQANASLKRGEWRRSAFVGPEVRNKTLGLLGLGNVGSEVAKRAKGLEMCPIAYDPFVTQEHAERVGVELVTFQVLLHRSDFISIHTPLTEDTQGLIGTEELKMVKPSVYLINTARGGIINEEALLEAVKEGRVAGAALDVFTHEPIQDSELLRNDRIIVTPHLGGSTVEAQTHVALEAAEQVLAILNGQPAQYAVNMPLVSPEARSILVPFIPVASYIGKLAIQLIEGQLRSISIGYNGDIANYDIAILNAALLGGLLEPISEERVTLVNAKLIAAKRGLRISEEKRVAMENYNNLITLEVNTNKGATIVAGTLIREQAHIVRINDYWLDLTLTGEYWLITDHLDRPGLVGAVGIITGEANVNINFMEVGRLEPRGRAMMILGLDEPLPEKAQKRITALPHIYSTKLIRL